MTALQEKNSDMLVGTWVRNASNWNNEILQNKSFSVYFIPATVGAKAL